MTSRNSSSTTGGPPVNSTIDGLISDSASEELPHGDSENLRNRGDMTDSGSVNSTEPVGDCGPIQPEPSGKLGIADSPCLGQLIANSGNTLSERHSFKVMFSLQKVNDEAVSGANIPPSTHDYLPGMPPPGSKKPYPKGGRQQVTESWKLLVRKRLAELGRDHRWLEHQIGTGRASVTKMLRPDQQTFSKVNEICAALHIPPPVVALESDDERELIERFRMASSRVRRHVLQTLQVLSEDQQEPPD